MRKPLVIGLDGDLEPDDRPLFEGQPEGAFPRPPRGTCAVCRARPATHWYAEGGLMEAIHGGAEARCMGCILRSQIERAEESAARLDKLRVELTLWERSQK